MDWSRPLAGLTVLGIAVGSVGALVGLAGLFGDPRATVVVTLVAAVVVVVSLGGGALAYLDGTPYW